MSNPEQKYLSQVEWAKLIVKAWCDPAFKDLLEQDPTTAIKQYAKDELGVELNRPIHIPPTPAELVEEILGDEGADTEKACASIQVCLFCSPCHGSTPYQ